MGRGTRRNFALRVVGSRWLRGRTVWRMRWRSIPTDSELLALEDYKAFLQERRSRIAARLNDFLGS